MNFYRNAGPDHCGRRLDDILRWDDAALENVHDYIQWLFPLDEGSAFNPYAPLLTARDCKVFSSDLEVATNLRRSVTRMLAFYGLRLRNGKIERDDRWTERSRVWLHLHNHNYLRLTRIMKSLVLLGRPELAGALRDALIAEYDRAPDRIGPRTLMFWKVAGSKLDEERSDERRT